MKKSYIEYSDQNRKDLFKGSAIDYVRMRADKHEKIYNMKRQADHLRMLANLFESELVKADTNFKWLLKQMDTIHNLLRFERVGTWQERTIRVIETVKKLKKEKKC